VESKTPEEKKELDKTRYLTAPDEVIIQLDRYYESSLFLFQYLKEANEFILQEAIHKKEAFSIDQKYLQGGSMQGYMRYWERFKLEIEILERQKRNIEIAKLGLGPKARSKDPHTIAESYAVSLDKCCQAFKKGSFSTSYMKRIFETALSDFSFFLELEGRGSAAFSFQNAKFHLSQLLWEYNKTPSDALKNRIIQEGEFLAKNMRFYDRQKPLAEIRTREGYIVRFMEHNKCALEKDQEKLRNKFKGKVMSFTQDLDYFASLPYEKRMLFSELKTLVCEKQWNMTAIERVVGQMKLDSLLPSRATTELEYEQALLELPTTVHLVDMEELKERFSDDEVQVSETILETLKEHRGTENDVALFGFANEAMQIELQATLGSKIALIGFETHKYSISGRERPSIESIFRIYNRHNQTIGYIKGLAYYDDKYGAASFRFSPPFLVEMKEKTVVPEEVKEFSNDRLKWPEALPGVVITPCDESPTPEKAALDMAQYLSDLNPRYTFKPSKEGLFIERVQGEEVLELYPFEYTYSEKEGRVYYRLLGSIEK
jgi:hypothetical protein